MYPHERSLVKQYKNRPFVILGVNSDPDREKLQKRIAEENITWRSWFAGSTGGEIPSRWNVMAWPTIYLIDHLGVIRAKNTRGASLDQWLAKLVKEAEDYAAKSQKQ